MAVQRLHAAFLHRLDDLLGGVGEVVGGDDLEPALGQDLLAQLDVGALEPHHQRHRERRPRFTAAITPSAMMSQRMMPPKMLTRMPFTFGSDRMILKASVTFSLEAPPPTSRKFAGSAP